MTAQVYFCHFILRVGTQSEHLYFCYRIEQKWIITTKGKVSVFFCEACWLRLSGIHHWRFGSRCLAFPFRWLNGQAGLCHAPSHLPSRFFLWREVSRRVLLIWGGAVESPVTPILTGADGGDESWPRHCPLTAHSQTPCFSPDVYPRLDSVENTAWMSWRRGESLAIPSPVLFSRWSSVGATWCPFFTSSRVVYHSSSSVLSFQRESKNPGRREIKSLDCILIVVWNWSSSF